MSERAAIYCRVSSDKQKEKGYSLATQEAACLAYCEERGYEVVEVYREDYTGTDLKRPELDRLRERLHRRRDVSVLVCLEPDRLSRAGIDRSSFLRGELERDGARVEYVRKQYSRDLSGDLMQTIDAHAAASYIEDLVERSTRGRLARAQSGLLPGGGPALYGYRYVDSADGKKKRARYELDPMSAPIVKRIYREYLFGASLADIATGLNRDNIPPPGASHSRYLPRESGRPLKWLHSTVRSILRHPTYKGEPQAYRWRSFKAEARDDSKPRGRLMRERPEGQPIELPAGYSIPDRISLAGLAPALVDEATWDAVQARLAYCRDHQRRPPQDPTLHLFRGHLYCAECGNPLTCSRTRGRPIYSCQRWRFGGCTVKSITGASRLDAALWGKVAESLCHPDLVQRQVERFLATADDRATRDLDTNTRALRELEGQQHHLAENLALLSGGAAAIVREKLTQVSAAVERLQAERHHLTRRAAAERGMAQKMVNLPALLDRLRQELGEEATFERKREVLRTLDLGARVRLKGTATTWSVDVMIALERGEAGLRAQAAIEDQTAGAVIREVAYSAKRLGV